VALVIISKKLRFTFRPSYIRTRWQQLSAKTLSPQIEREYALKHDVDILQRQSPPLSHLPHFIHFFCATLLNQTEVVWLSVRKTLNSEENL